MSVMKSLFALGVVMLSATTVGCAVGAEASSAPALAHSFESVEALIDATLGALADQDDERLASYLITRDEWEQLLWPEMPDQEHTPFEFVWGLSSRNSTKGRAEALVEYGGLSFRRLGVGYSKEPEIYPSFTLHKGARVLVGRTDTSETGILPIFDVFVDYGGQWKLMNFDEL